MRNKHFSLSNPGCSSTHEIMEVSLALCISASSWHNCIHTFFCLTEKGTCSPPQLTVCKGLHRLPFRNTASVLHPGLLRPSLYLQTLSLTPLSQTGTESSGFPESVPHPPSARPCPQSFVWLEIPRPRSNLSPTLNSGLCFRNS